MRLRAAVGAVVLAAVGVAGGVAAGRATQDRPAAIDAAAPVPAASPSYPVEELDVLPDPTIAPLAPGLPTHQATFSAGGLRLAAPVPDGWRRVELSGRTSWNFSVPDNPPNTFVLRIGLVAGNRTSVLVAKAARIAALEDSERNGALDHLDVESETDDGYVATYLEDGHLRVAMERWLPVHDSTQAYAVAAVTGREVDREGMADLLERVVSSASY
jgi:hypothetical protein